jgi:glycerol-3-phosphate acyltransferase PlsX
MPIRIAIDAMGGDNAPEALINGAFKVAKSHEDVELILVGLPNQLPNKDSLPKNIFCMECGSVMGMDESVKNIRKKQDSSIWIATKLVKDGEADAVISCGSTGAQMSAALLLLKRIPGISRPAISLTFPNVKGGSILLDAGANIELTPEQYQQFGLMGSVAAEILLNRNNPKVALLANGTEEHKGTEDLREAYQLLQNSAVNFCGFMEARTIMEGEVDVIVTDGFTGNVVIKEAEGISKTLMSILKEELKSSLKTKMGALLAKDAFINLKSVLDYKRVGGAPLLGIRGVSMVCHGSSDSRAVENAILTAKNCVESKFIEKLAEKVQNEIEISKENQDK